MTEKILFDVKKHGRYSTMRPPYEWPSQMEDAFITITSESLIIRIKKSSNEIIIPLNEIDIAERVEEKHTNIIAKRNEPFYITFYSQASGWQVELHDEFHSILKSQLNKLQKDTSTLDEKIDDILKKISDIYIKIHKLNKRISKLEGYHLI